MKVDGDKLDPDDSYSSDWRGDASGFGETITFSGDGRPAIGFIGRKNQKDMTAMGFLFRDE